MGLFDMMCLRLSYDIHTRFSQPFSQVMIRCLFTAVCNTLNSCGECVMSVSVRRAVMAVAGDIHVPVANSLSGYESVH